VFPTQVKEAGRTGPHGGLRHAVDDRAEVHWGATHGHAERGADLVQRASRQPRQTWKVAPLRGRRRDRVRRPPRLLKIEVAAGVPARAKAIPTSLGTPTARAIPTCQTTTREKVAMPSSASGRRNVGARSCLRRSTTASARRASCSALLSRDSSPHREMTSMREYARRTMNDRRNNPRLPQKSEDRGASPRDAAALELLRGEDGVPRP
jgi:hypothetical protein